MNIVALSSDLMDRSRITATCAARFVRDPAGCAGADVVIVDLARFGNVVAAVRAAAPRAHIVCYGPHVDEDAATDARASGADVVLPRSRFFRDISAAIVASTDG